MFADLEWMGTSGKWGTGLCNNPEQMYLPQPSVPLHKYQQHIAAFDTAQPEASTSLFVASTQQSLPQARACMDGDQINTHAFTACLAADKGRPSMAKAFRVEKATWPTHTFRSLRKKHTCKYFWSNLTKRFNPISKRKPPCLQSRRC